MSAKMQVIFPVPRVFGLRKVIPPSIRSKITRAETLKRLHKDNKALFGELVETKKEKTAREKREKKLTSKEPALDLTRNKAQVDTEIYYLSRAKKQQIFKVKFKGESLPYCTKKILQIPSSEKPVEDIESLGLIATPPNTKPSPDARFSQPEAKPDSITSNGNGKKELNLPSDILINRITSFSYLDNKKNVRENLEGGEPISISPYSDRTKLAIPSVTRILNQTMSAESKLNLELWKQRMILQLGQDGFDRYSQGTMFSYKLCDDELLQNGKQFHSSIQNYLIKKPFEVPSEVENSWQSVQHVLKEVNAAQVIESHVVHSKLYYRGVVDCVAMYRGKLCVIDWKKSDKPKNSIENTFDAPVQVASYIGALNSDSNYNFQVEKGLVVVGYTDGAPASVHEINPTLLNKYWILWLRRLQQYYLDLKSAK